jgi:membrane associated rhomboid family serine protease
VVVTYVKSSGLKDRMGIENRSYYRDSYDEQFVPWRPGGERTVVLTLIILNFVIFGIDLFTPRVAGDGTVILRTEGVAELGAVQGSGHWLSHFMSLKSEMVQKPWQFFNLLTYGFAHTPLDAPGGPFHILFNMVTLLFLGHAVEAHYGRREFLRFYLVAIVISGLAFLFSSWMLGAARSCLGASGAVTAVVMLFILNFPKQKLMLFGAFGMPAWVLGVLLIVLDLLRALNPESRIAVETHLMGAAFAAVYFYGRWSFSALGSTTRRGGRGTLQIHDPDDEEQIDDVEWAKLQTEGDRILEKINQHGQDSLTWRERRTLKSYSEKLRKRRG